MPISDYLKARCELYRTPTLDLTPIMGIIERRMVEAWQQNYNPANAIAQLAGDKTIRNQLAAQVADHLKFREQEESRKLNDATNSAMGAIQGETSAKITALKNSYMQKEATLTQRVEQTAVEHQIKQTDYQRTVDEIEKQKQKALDATAKIGGNSALESILAINDEIVAEAGVTHNYNAGDDEAIASTILETTDKIDPLRKPDQYNTLVHKAEKKAKRKGIFSRMYNFFTGWYRK